MKSKGITEKAQNAIFDEEQFRCATPDECLEFLQDDSNFKNISEQLIESVERKTGIDRTEDETIDYLTDELMKLR